MADGGAGGLGVPAWAHAAGPVDDGSPCNPLVLISPFVGFFCLSRGCALSGFLWSNHLMTAIAEQTQRAVTATAGASGFDR